MKYGIYYAFWTHSWDVDFIPYVKKAAECGFDILEVNSGTLADMTASERKYLQSAADDSGILLTYCIGLTADYDVASEDPETRNRGVEFLKKQVRAVGEMGGGKISGIIYGAWPGTLPADSDKRPFTERSIGSIRKVVKTAEDANVFLNVEVVNRFEQFLLNTCEEALEYVEKVASPNCGILLDTYHMNIEEDNIGDAIKRAGRHLNHLHIGENNRKPPGCGHIPWSEIGAALKTISYTGTVVMEPFVEMGGEIGRDIKVWRAMMPEKDMDSELKKSLGFVKRHFNA